MSDKDHNITTGTDHKVCNFNTSRPDGIFITKPYSTQSENIINQRSTPPYEGRVSVSDRVIERSRDLQSLKHIFKSKTIKTKSEVKSLDPEIVVIKNGTSLSMSLSSIDTISVTSDMYSSTTCSSPHCSSYQSQSSVEGPITSIFLSDNEDGINQPATTEVIKSIEANPRREYKIFKLSQTKLDLSNTIIAKSKRDTKRVTPIELPSKIDISKIMEKIMKQKRFCDASSIFIIVPTSDDNNAEELSDSLKSITSIKSNDTHIIARHCCAEEPDLTLRKNESSTKHEVQVCGKGKKFYMQEILSSNDIETIEKESIEVLKHIEMTKNKFCQIAAPNDKIQILDKADVVFGADTTLDRPCCCCPKKSSTTFVVQNCSSSKDHYVANVMSRKSTPLFLRGETSGWYYSPSMRTPFSVSSILPCNIPMCSGHSSCHVPSNYSQRHRYYQRNSYNRPQPTFVPKRSYREPYRNPEVPLPCACYSKYSTAELQKSHLNLMRYRGYRKCGTSGTCSFKSVEGLSCECHDTETVNIRRKIKICPCGSNPLLDPQPGPTVGTKSMGMVTELKGSEIINLQRRKPSQEKIEETQTQPGINMTKLDDIADKKQSLTPKASPGNFTESVTPKNAKPSTSKADCVCQDVKGAGVRIDQSGSRKSTQQKKNKIKKSKVTPAATKAATSKSDCACQDIRGPAMISDPMTSKSSTSQKPRKLASVTDPNVHQPSHQPNSEQAKQPKVTTDISQPSTSKADCVCKDVKVFGDVINRKGSRKTKKSKNSPDTTKTSNSKAECVCQDVEGPAVVSDPLKPSQSSRSQTSKKQQKTPKEPVSPKKSNKISNFFSKKDKSSSLKLDCACSEENLKDQVGKKPTDGTKDLKSPEKSKKVKDPDHHETKEKKSNLFASIRKSLSSKIPLAQKASKNPKKTKSPITSSDCLCNENKNVKKKSAGKPVCGCSDEQGNNDKKRKVICKCKETKKKKKSITIIDPKSATKPAEGLQPQSAAGTKQAPQPQPVSNIDKIPQSQLVSDIEQAPLTQPLPDSEKIPLTDTTLPQNPDDQQKEHPQQMFQPQQIQKMPQPKQEPQIELKLPPEVIPEGYLYEGIGPSCGWIDSGEIMKMRSELTVSSSGFKARKKKRKLHKSKDQENIMKLGTVEPEIDLNFEEAIRFFALMNPERFRELMQDEIQKQVDAEMDKKKNSKKLQKKKEKEMKEIEKQKKKAEKDSKKGKKNSKDIQQNKDLLGAVTTPAAKMSPEQMAEMYPPTGFKFAIAGPCTPGPGGTICFEMTKVAYISWCSSPIQN